MKINFDKNFDWFETLQHLNSGEKISDYDNCTLMVLAREWPTCACGQLCKALPRQELTNAPLDNVLRQLGTEFYIAVCHGRWVTAINIFQEIEKRTAELLGLKLVKRQPATAWHDTMNKHALPNENRERHKALH